MWDPSDQHILRRMNQAGSACYLPADIADAIDIPVVDVYSRLEHLEISGHVQRLPGSEPRTYALTYLGLELATAA
ncbi:MAG: hypothetical protein QOF51_1145 [Chloroflexota bacterium]|nr:hypothetical protein [Chloroflexota bacterium]